jgi:hypothetical protein
MRDPFVGTRALHPGSSDFDGQGRIVAIYGRCYSSWMVNNSVPGVQGLPIIDCESISRGGRAETFKTGMAKDRQ